MDNLLQPLPDEPLVTIVTPSYNQGRFIEETIQSVLAQDYPHIEYMIMDGGSTDPTAEIVRKYEGRLLFISERDRGQAHAINKGFHRARGQILAFLNSDDTYVPGAVSSAAAALKSHPEAGFVYGEGYHIGEDGTVLERYPTEPFSKERLLETCFICQPTVFMRQEAVRAAGYLDESLQFCMDYELWYRLSRRFPPVYLPRHLANSRMYSENKTLGQRRAVHWEIALMWRRRLGEVPSSWVFSLAHAIVATRLPLDRSKPWQNGAFVLLLTLVSVMLCLRLNRRVRPEEAVTLKGWLGSLKDGLKQQIGWTP